MFLLVGLAIPPTKLLDALGPIAWAVVAILVGRALVVYVLLGGASRLRLSPGSPVACRAAGSTSCSGPVCAGRWPWPWRCPSRPTSRSAPLLQEITFGVVLFTLLVQGTTIGWVVDKAIGSPGLGDGAPAEAGTPVDAEAT